MLINKFDQEVNMILSEDWKSIAAAGALGLASLSPNVAQAGDSGQIATQANEDSFLSAAYDYIKANEGEKLMPYRDTEGHWTIGVGHKILPNEDFSGGITEEESRQLFESDLQERLSVARRLFKNFDSYPDYVKVALLDGVFRGDHKASYRTTRLINENRFAEAAKEYLNHGDYTRSKKEGTGVWKRMYRNAQAMMKYADELGQVD